MKKSFARVTSLCALMALVTTGCHKSGSVWDDNHTAGNYRPDRSMWEEDDSLVSDLVGPDSESFIALNDDDLKAQFSDGAIPQPRHAPGEAGSGIPSLASFRSPQAEESKVFAHVYFNTDDHIIRGKEYLTALDQMAAYLKAHPNLYVSISGHCDERGPEAYNLSLGSRRANYIRSKLIEKGVSSERVHTVSYGKEKPVRLEHNPEAWSKNRRAEFKVFQKS